MNNVASRVGVLAGLVLLVLVTGCASTKQKERESLLSAAGFKMVPADTPQQQAHLQTLPAGKVSMTRRDGKTYFVYPDPAHNVLYVGNQAQYDQYQNLRVKNQMSQEQLSAAELNTDWGPGGAWY